MKRLELAIGIVIALSLPSWAMVQSNAGQQAEAEYTKSGFGMMLSGSSLADKNNMPQAVSNFKKANERIPNSLLNTFSLGEATYEMAERLPASPRKTQLLRDAQWAFIRVTNINPDFILGYYKLSEVTWDLEEYDEALQYINQGLENHPDDVVLSYSKALAFEKLNRMDEAIEAYKAVLKINPRFSPSYNSLAIIYEEQGNTKEAEALYRQAVESLSEKDKTPFRINLANLLIELDRYSEAEPLLEESLQTEPDNFMIYLSLGHVFYGRRDFDKAIAYYAVASELNPEYADTYYYLSITLGKMNRPTEALEQSVHYISLSPDGDYAGTVKKMILDLKAKTEVKP